MNPGKTESLRLFFALWPDDATRTELMRLQASIRGRLIPYSNLHLTLAFLGQQPAALVPDLQEILSRLAAETANLKLDRVGYFSRTHIAWAGTHETPQELLQLAQELTLALAQHGIRLNNPRDFTPHITLARDAAPPQDFNFEPIAWRAHQAALVQSDTMPEGSVYRVLASRSLDEKCWQTEERESTTYPRPAR